MGVSRETRREPPLIVEEFVRETDATADQVAAVAYHLDLLAKWQPRINLVGPATLADPWRRHALDSAQLVPLIGTPDGPVIDMGSGAGFPGLVLAALGVAHVVVIESDARKAVFLREVIREAGLSASVAHTRIQAYDGPRAALVTARALASLGELLTLARPLLAEGGRCLFPKGRTWRDELTESQAVWHIEACHHPSRTDPDGAILEIIRYSPRHP